MLLVANGSVFTRNAQTPFIPNGAVAIDGDTIVEVGPERELKAKYPDAEYVDAQGNLIMPGLINCHTHLATSVLRCFTDDLTNKEALEALLQKEAKMDSRSAKAAALLSIAECLRFGVTSVSDLYYYPNATAQAVAESGIKANLALSSYRYIDQNEEFDFETDEQCRELQKVVDKWHGYDNGRIKIDAGIFAEYTSNYPLWESLAGYASEKGLGMQLHLSETRNEVDSCLDRTGMTPGELLACHRLFAVPATASGCAFLESEEAKICLLYTSPSPRDRG